MGCLTDKTTFLKDFKEIERVLERVKGRAATMCEWTGLNGLLGSRRLNITMFTISRVHSPGPLFALQLN